MPAARSSPSLGFAAVERHASLPQRLAAEVAGTFALVFVAAGADTLAVVSAGAVDVQARAVAPALIVAALIYGFSDASGAHFNPVATLAFAVKGCFPWSLVAPYWFSQLIGALAAATILRVLFGADAASAGVPTPHVDPGIAVALECLLTWLLVTVILGTADRSRIVGPEAALAVGATIAACGLMALPVEGAIMNPARALGPAVVNGRLGDMWIYVLGPGLAAPIAVVTTALIHGGRRTADAARAAQGE